jgi:hypothetical protein
MPVLAGLELSNLLPLQLDKTTRESLSNWNATQRPSGYFLNESAKSPLAQERARSALQIPTTNALSIRAISVDALGPVFDAAEGQANLLDPWKKQAPPSPFVVQAQFVGQPKQLPDYAQKQGPIPF